MNKKMWMSIGALLVLIAAQSVHGTQLEDRALRITPYISGMILAVDITGSPSTSVDAVRWRQEGNVLEAAIVVAPTRNDIDLGRAVASANSPTPDPSGWASIPVPEIALGSDERVYLAFRMAGDPITGDGRSGIIFGEQNARRSVSLGLDGSWVELDSDLTPNIDVSYVPTSAAAPPSGALMRSGPVAEAEGSDATASPVARSEMLLPRPNPCNPSAQIRFRLAREERVDIRIYNVKGELVWTGPKRVYGVGDHQVEWTGQDNGGRSVASGVYLVRLRSTELDQSRRVTVLK